MTFWDWMTANEEVLGAGKGLYCPLHICLIVFLFAWIAASFFIFRKWPKFSKIFCLSTVIFMLVSRTFRMIFLACVQDVNIWTNILPWHLCHIMCFVMGILFLTKSKKFATPVAIFAMIGSIMTFMFGDYYKYNALTFLDIESILCHFMLCTVAMYYIATKKVVLTYKSVAETAIFMLLLACYAELGNTIFKTTNFMFIRQNGLPFKVFPGSHIFTYMLLFVLVYGSLFGVVAIKNAIKKKRIKPEKAVETQSILEAEPLVKES